ncbi:MAG: AAA family ATPase [Thermoplasmata archaeon]|nr:AAA family ATPase [Thermoplasmata archaeon]
MDLEFNRREARDIEGVWALLYGRRKTGKTYLLRHMIEDAQYILVGREGTVWIEGNPDRRIRSIDELTQHVREALERGERIILDEFQRIPMDDLEWISSVHPAGQLILSGSSMSVVKKVLGPGSPLLGRFRERRLSLISPIDLFRDDRSEFGLDHAPYLSDPWTIPLLKGGDLLKDIYRLLEGTAYTVPSLVGEIFHEEDRTLSEIYQSLLSSIGSGRSRPHEMATDLFRKGVISKESPSQVSPYLKALEKMGLIESIRIFQKKRNTLRFASPVMTLYYYMDGKYGLEKGLPPFDTVKQNLRRIHSICMEHYLTRAFAKKMGGELRYSFDPELDGVVVNRNERPIAAIEVKWKDLRGYDIENFMEKTRDLDCNKIILTRSNYRGEHEGVSILSERDIISHLRDPDLDLGE